MPDTKIRTLIADDHALLRRGMRLVLDAEAGFEVVAEASDGREALARALAEPDLDLAILDVSMPGMSGLQAAEQLRRRRPSVRVVMLSMHDHERFRGQASEIGASAYVLKSAADRDLVVACRAAVAAPAPADGRDDPNGDEDGLSVRELQVLKLIAEARTGVEIAQALSISPKTVERHRGNLLEKLGMRDRVELTRYAIKRGLIEP
jgi:DNA-binding NarL/FixJ family response regulator